MKKILLILVVLSFCFGGKMDEKLVSYKFDRLKEKNFVAKIEFGKNLLLDCNAYFFSGGKITQDDEGVYKFSDKNVVLAGTKMLCYEEKTTKFVFYSQKLFLDNPDEISIKVPKDIEVKITIYKEKRSEFLK